MIGDYRLDPPDFETVEEILEGCFSLQEAQEFVMCQNYINWYENDLCDEESTPNSGAWYYVCFKTAKDILDDIKSNCQEYDLADADIIEHLMHVGK